MKLISDIINELVDSEKSISSPLLKTKVLASQLKNIELLTWVNQELGGYDTNSEVPDYRHCIGAITGTYINGDLRFYDQPLATIGLQKEIEEAIKSMDFNQSIATLESMIVSGKPGTLELVFPAEISRLIEENIQNMGNDDFQLINAKKSTSTNILVEILSIVRSKLLDFMLKLDDEFGNLTEINELRKSNERITTIMNQTIINTGDGNILNTGEGVSISANMVINKGDKLALEKNLLQKNVSDEDVKALLDVIDNQTPNGKVFGSSVNEWIQKMIGKALDGSWDISVGAAGTLLAEAIQKYYGL